MDMTFDREAHPVCQSIGKMDQETVRAFWSKVEIKDEARECWPWLGAKASNGYGNVRINKKYLKAHRVAWELANFPIPEGYQVMHICDNPSCCNPSHLVLGTSSSNFCDMLFKKREGFKKNKACGERNCNAKLSNEKVKEIRSVYPKLSQRKLAEKFNVTQTAISAVLLGKTWREANV